MNKEHESFEVLKGLKELLDEGVITQEEFDRKKQDILFGRKQTSTQQKAEIKKSAGKGAKTFELVSNIVMISLFVLIILLIGLSRVGTGQYYLDYAYTISPFEADDVRCVFSILALIIPFITVLICIFNLMVKKRLLVIIKHISTIISLAFAMIALIFNLIYASSYVDGCTLTALIFTCVLVLFEVVHIIYIITIAYKSRANNRVK